MKLKIDMSYEYGLLGYGSIFLFYEYKIKNIRIYFESAILFNEERFWRVSLVLNGMY